METIRAVVTSINPQGQNGPFAIATSDDVEGSITFSLSRNTWREGKLPEPGDAVFLSDLRKKQAGWRAMSGRFLKPTDEE